MSFGHKSNDIWKLLTDSTPRCSQENRAHNREEQNWSTHTTLSNLTPLIVNLKLFPLPISLGFKPQRRWGSGDVDP